MVHDLSDRSRVVFDDERVVVNAGVVLAATLGRRLGLEQLVDAAVRLGGRPGASRPGRKVLSLVHAMLLGADCIDDCDVLRSGRTEAVLGHRAMAPSTLGTFLRSFSFGHVRQLDRVLGPPPHSEPAELLGRRAVLGHGPGVDGHRQPNLAAAGYSKQTSFLNWASANGYRNVSLVDGYPWYDGSQRNTYGLLDFNRDGSEGSTPVGGQWRAETTYYDFDQDSWLSDAERDEDADGLTNYDETRGRATSGYWVGCYNNEHAYTVTYGDTDPTDPDVDGDGVRDGADDQDHDDVPNVMELSRNAASGRDDTLNGAGCKADSAAVLDPDQFGRMNPFNPCLPDRFSRTCTRFVGLGSEAPAPFDGSPDWQALN